MPPLARWHLGSLLPFQSISRLLPEIDERWSLVAIDVSTEDEALLGDDENHESLLLSENESLGRRARYVLLS